MGRLLAWQTVIDSTDSTNGINQKNLATGVIYTWTGDRLDSRLTKANIHMVHG